MALFGGARAGSLAAFLGAETQAEHLVRLQSELQGQAQQQQAGNLAAGVTALGQAEPFSPLADPAARQGELVGTLSQGGQLGQSLAQGLLTPPEVTPGPTPMDLAKLEGQQLKNQQLRAELNALASQPPAPDPTVGEIMSQAFTAQTGAAVPAGTQAVLGPSGGMEIIPLRNSPEFKKDRNMMRASEDAVQAAQTITSLIDTHGVELGGETAAVMGEAHQQLINSIRVLENLGTPQAAEMAALFARFPMPAGPGARAGQIASAVGPQSIMSMLSGGNVMDVLSGQQFVNDMLATYGQVLDQGLGKLTQMRSDLWYIDQKPGVGVP